MALYGTVILPGDKSISHRAIMLACLTEGPSVLHNVNRGADVKQTVAVLKRCGMDIQWQDDTVTVQGAGRRPFLQPHLPLDCGNSGTTVRLAMGLVAGYPLQVTFTGDDSLSQRPMSRIIVPLRQMGARISTRNQGYLPVMLTGGELWGIQYDLPIPSAQVKSAIILAALNAQTETSVTSPLPSRDHTERMLKHLGAPITMEGNTITVKPLKKSLKHADYTIPGDISGGAFLIAAALLVPDSEVLLQGVSLNPTRTAFLEVVKAMGAQVKVTKISEVAGEPVGDILSQSSQLHGITIPSDQIPNLQDELPLIALLATQAEGETAVSGAEELKVKESDRIEAIVTNLQRWGADIQAKPDGFVVRGFTPLTGGRVHTHHDHRIAMMMSVGGLVAREPERLDDKDCMAVSFPGFLTILDKLQHD
ncbi:MAG: 3-phosphoshikimate 1-carboxyvinyltransferase [Candidatus Marinimicrobia bacterium]|nr:3-phosphoshikimate 1-carboxyvinyltransferase [Candidatus Neomarinimicrobiota bacterium]MCF7840709.1 3-phosphoshikimate 1-carboxyvinyltransferase [Candidatus Neomarinimicrobiota bacterium]MCF7902730.1 3-phosphoshikimate 1-carboxyvinyltransferase [Candidatus Neomarinimicrobiota bacterium]